MAESKTTTESEIREQFDQLVERVQALETENLTLKEENIELMENAESLTDSPEKYKLIEGFQKNNIN